MRGQSEICIICIQRVYLVDTKIEETGKQAVLVLLLKHF